MLVLAYHRIARDGPQALDQWRLAPDRFDEQMNYLKSCDLEVTSIEDWYERPAMLRQHTPKRSVAITFDDAFLDFETTAWPILETYGFAATVFVPTGLVGGAATWDMAAGPPAPLMSWPQIRDLSRRGVFFGSHGSSHTPLDQLEHDEVIRELAESKERLEHELGIHVSSLAYPYGQQCADVRRTAGELGYKYALTVESGVCLPDSDPLQLPRFEVNGRASVNEFARHVNALLGGERRRG